MAIDIDQFSQAAGRLDVSDLDIEGGFARQPLTADARRCLLFMHDIESHTVCYLRDLLVTRAHADPEITAFLTMWNYEEYWHGVALGRILDAHGDCAGRHRVSMVRTARSRRDRWRPLAFLVGSALLPELTTVSLTWGAVNEMTTQAGYARLAARAGHPVLTEILRRIMRQEGRHIAFYAGAAEDRLSPSRRAQRLTRTALRRLWAPVGTGVRPAEEVGFVVRYLFGGDAGASAAARIDRRIDRLPGLAGLSLVAGARDRAA